jgi:uncharacterized membrane protein YeaQ/YmgE (transglycosylase-associated protein family)
MQVVVTAVAVGLIIGWLANVVTGMTGSDQLRFILVGVAGSLIGEVVIENVGFPISPPFVTQIISNAASAIILIVAANIYLRFYRS